MVMLFPKSRDRSNVHTRDREGVFVLKDCARSIGRQSVTRSDCRVIGSYIAHDSMAFRDFLDNFDELNMLSTIAGRYESLHLPYSVWGAWNMEGPDDRWV